MAALPNQSTASSTLYVLLEGGQYFAVAGAASRVQVDVDLYDGSTHRKIVDAAMLGNAHSILIHRPNSLAAQTQGTGVSFSTATSVTIGPSALTLNGAETSYEPTVATDSAFRVGADDVIPGRTMKTRTLFQWWSATNGTGNLIAEIWADEIRGYSTAAPLNLT